MPRPDEIGLPQDAVEDRHAGDRGGGDHQIAGDAERAFPGEAEELRAAVEPDRIGRQRDDGEREYRLDEQSAEIIADEAEDGGNREVEDDVRPDPGEIALAAEPVGDDRRAAELGRAAEYPGEQADALERERRRDRGDDVGSYQELQS